MSDSASIRSSRASSMLNRPHPMGPRGRQGLNRTSHISDSGFTSAASPQANNDLDLPEFGSVSSPPMSPASNATFGRPDRKSLPSLAEELRPSHEPEAEDTPSFVEDNKLTAPTTTPVNEDFDSTMSASESEPEQEEENQFDSEVEQQQQAEEEAEEEVEEMNLETPHAYPEERHRPEELQVKNLPEVPEPEASPAFQPAPLPIRANPRVVATTPLAQPRLTIPQAVKFEATPVQWKSLPLDAALLTVDSDELQTIVSRAIHGYAQDSSVRLITLENLNKDLPAELERLEHLRLVTQSKYRFLCHRRTMLFQALNSTTSSTQKDADGTSVVNRLTTQLAETIGDCDQHLAEVINITDQIGQIHRLIDIHSGSALSLALRKLNRSYARRVDELKETKEKIHQLEAELEDAWKEAEKMALELDDYEAAINADEEGIIEMAEVVPVPTPSAHVRRLSAPMSPTLMAVTVTPNSSPPRNADSKHVGSLAPDFTFPPAHMKAKESETGDIPDTISLRSARSAKSGRNGEGRNSISVQAAKKRGHRASQGSLRLSSSHFRRPSNGQKLKSPVADDQPPVPEIPVQFAPPTNTPAPPPAAVRRTSAAFLQLDPSSPQTPSLRKQGSLDTVCTTGRSPRTTATEYKARGRGADDLYVRPLNSPSNEVMVVPRTPPAANQTFAEMHFVDSSPMPPKDPSKDIPSMWMNADTKKAPTTTTVTDQCPTLTTMSSSSDPGPGATVNVGVPLRLSTIAPAIQRQSSEQEPPSATSSSATRQGAIIKNTTINKLKTLTKRYSVSLPMFNSKPSLTSTRRSE